ncbi:MAG: dihydroneopterin aldolase [Bacteroidetes bacterium]|nr:dihydroneopterin aldolase [Bacteroidota bacterium]
MYESEAILGNQFLVNIKVGLPEKYPLSVLENSVDYEILLSTVQKCFTERKSLLEEIVENIERETKSLFPKIQYFLVSIQKLNPPMSAEIFSSEVSLEIKYP